MLAGTSAQVTAALHALTVAAEQVGLVLEPTKFEVVVVSPTSSALGAFPPGLSASMGSLLCLGPLLEAQASVVSMPRPSV